MKRFLISFFITLSIGVLVVSSMLLFKYGYESNESENFYSSLTEDFVLPDPFVPGREEQEPVPFPQIDFEMLRQTNDDVVGWLYCEGSRINYPVVQAADNSYYLDRRFNQAPDANGTLFLDYRNSPDFSNCHNIIYGHHMHNGSMLSSLLKYKNQEYYDENPILYLITPALTYRIKLFSGYVAADTESAWQTDFADPNEFKNWFDQAARRSTFSSDVIPLSTDHIISLSTCSYEFENARFVLLGVLQPIDKENTNGI